MRFVRRSELIVGSAQLGLAYGAANRTGKPARRAALQLVRKAADAGVAGFDTARAYGESEERLGEALEGRSVPTFTKLSPLAELPPDAPLETIVAAVDDSVATSLKALKRDQLDCLLLHRAAQLSALQGAVWKRLEHHLAEGTVRSLGVSVQSPGEAFEALRHRNVKHLQLPFNLLDWRWSEAGVIAALRGRSDVTVHARSVFLQGLLASGDETVWPRVEGVNPSTLISWLDDCVRRFRRESRADLCLAHARGQDWIDGVVVGMETEEQLETNLRLSTRPPLTSIECKAIESSRPRVPEQLLDPARWPRR